MVHVWEYVSKKEYIDAFPQDSAQQTKITVELQNYSNLLLKNNQDWKYPLTDHEVILTTLEATYPCL